MDKDFFNKIASNTLAGSSNQHFFCPENPQEVYTGRVFYKVFQGGRYNYSFLFSSILDSSFWEGSNRNAEIVGWEIVRAQVGISKSCSLEEMPDVGQWQPLFFEGKRNKRVETAELFASDALVFCAEKDEYICLEISYRGENIPRHYENWIAAFIKEGKTWKPSNQVVFANMVACDRAVKKRIAFLGDSITQGIGVEKNSYKNWCALLAEKLGEEYAFWNLGIGFATANDAATDGVWLHKAKRNDIVFVCFGVNDIFRIQNTEQTKRDLLKIIQLLKEAGCKIVLQTPPPFNFTDDNLKRWKEIVAYIKEELSKLVDVFYDCIPILEDEQVEGKAKYNGHPDEIGCALWANALYDVVQNIIKQ